MPDEIKNAKKGVSTAVKVVAGVAAVGCLTAAFTIPMLKKPSSEQEPIASSSVSEALSEAASMPAPSAAPEPTEEPSISSEAAESAASSEAQESTSKATTNSTKSTGTASSKKAAAPLPTPEPRMKEKTDVYCYIGSPDEHGYYGKLYCPTAAIDKPVFVGDDDIEKKEEGFAQQDDTFQIGFDGSHIFWTTNKDNVYCMEHMYVGEKFQFETDYGVYVYSVTNIDTGRRDKVDYKIYNDNGKEIGEFYSLTDECHLMTEYDDGRILVVTASLVL